jgi:hypothetical protein
MQWRQQPASLTGAGISARASGVSEALGLRQAAGGWETLRSIWVVLRLGVRKEKAHRYRPRQQELTMGCP